MNSNSSDLSSSCRVCLQKDSSTLKSILNTYLDSEWYPDIFLKCTEIKITEKPEQPNWICEECDAELIRAYKFRRKCIASDAVLSEVFVKDINIKTEEIEIFDYLIKEEPNFDKSYPGNELSDNDDDLYENILLKKEDKPMDVCNEDQPKTKTPYNKYISTQDTTLATPFGNAINDQRSSLPDFEIPRPEPSRSFIPVTEEFIERAISKAFLPIQQWMTRNDTRMERLENILPLVPEDADINIENVEDVQKLERDLMNSDYRRKIASSLSALGGKSEKDMMRRIFKFVFPNVVLIKYSWRGTSEKLVFKDLIFIKKTICNAITNLNQFKKFTASDYDNFCKMYIRQAKILK